MLFDSAEGVGASDDIGLVSLLGLHEAITAAMSRNEVGRTPTQ